MTIGFYKLQVAGNDFVLIDSDRQQKGFLPEGDSSVASDLSQIILDRRCGVGGRGCIFVNTIRHEGSPGLAVRVFLSDGSESFSGWDPLLCAARWAFDSGLVHHNSILLQRASVFHEMYTVDSKTFMTELRIPKIKRLTLIVDGRPASAYLITIQKHYAVAIAALDGPGPRRVRQALASIDPEAIPIVVRPKGSDIIRYVGPERADRLESAAAAIGAARNQGKIDGEAIAEWHGRGGAVSYADFSNDSHDIFNGPATLVDRGRFWIETRDSETFRVAGISEYAFEGNFDY